MARDERQEHLKNMGFGSGHPVTDLVQMLTYRYDRDRDGTERGYFLAADGAFWQVYRLQPFVRDTLSLDQAAAVSARMNAVLNALPEGTCAQLLRYTHNDISAPLGRYLGARATHPPTTSLADDIRNSVVQRQIRGANTGFFANIRDRDLQRAESAAVNEASGAGDPDFASNLTHNIQASMNQGRHAQVTELYFAVRWHPDWTRREMGALRRLWYQGRWALGIGSAYRTLRQRYYEALYDFFHNMDRLEQVMIRVGALGPQRLSGQGLLSLLYREMNPERARQPTPDDGLPDTPGYRPDLGLREQLLRGDESRSDFGDNGLYSPVTIHDEGWDIDGVYHRPVSLGSCPAQVWPRMLDEVLLNTDFTGWTVLNFHVWKHWQISALLKMRRSMFDLVQTARQSVPLLRGDPKVLEQRQAHFETFAHEINPEQQDAQAAINTSVHFVVHGTDRNTVNQEARALEQALWRKGIRERLHGAGVIYASVPGNLRPDVQRATQRDIPMIARDVAEFLPVYDAFDGLHSSPAVLLNNTQGSPVFMDFFAEETPAPHGLVVGGTGSGKSFAVQNINLQMAAYSRTKQFIIDKGGSFRISTTEQGGDYVDLQLTDDPDKRVCINPFHIQPDADTGGPALPSNDEMEFMVGVLIAMATTGTGGGVELRLEKRDRNMVARVLRDLFARRYKRLKDLQKNDAEGYAERANADQLHLTRDIIHYMEDTETLTDAYGEDFARRAKEFAENISDYSIERGYYGALFDGDLSLSWDNDIIGFETDAVSGLPCFNVIMMCLFYQITLYCKYRLPEDVRKQIVMDEAHMGLADPAIAGRLADYIYTMRKHGTSILLIVQSLGQLKTLLDAEANAPGGGRTGGLIANLSHFILLACSSDDHKLAPDMLSMSPEEVAAWANVSNLPPYYSEFLYRYRLQSGEFSSGKMRLYSNPVALWMSTASSRDTPIRRRYIEHYIEQGLSQDEARSRALRDLARELPYGSAYPPADTGGPAAPNDDENPEPAAATA